MSPVRRPADRPPDGEGTAQVGLEAVCAAGRDCMVYDYVAIFL